MTISSKWKDTSIILPEEVIYNVKRFAIDVPKEDIALFDDTENKYDSPIAQKDKKTLHTFQWKATK